VRENRPSAFVQSETQANAPNSRTVINNNRRGLQAVKLAEAPLRVGPIAHKPLSQSLRLDPGPPTNSRVDLPIAI
jgi:hypothetical protein